MTSNAFKKMPVLGVLSTVVFATSAHAGPAFNKFTTQPTASNPQDQQVLRYTVINPTDADATPTIHRVKRLVKPITTEGGANVSFAADHDTANKETDFNKMMPRSEKESKKMPVITYKHAHRHAYTTP